MNWVDVLVLAVWGIIALWGLAVGLLRMVIPLVVIAGGLALSSRAAEPVGNLFSPLTNNENSQTIAAFITIFVALFIVAAGVSFLLQTVMRVLPLSGLANRLAGMAVGILAGFVLLSGVLVGLQEYPVGQTREYIDGSTLGPLLANNFAVVIRRVGLIPGGWRGASFHPFTLERANEACVPWAAPSMGSTRNCDPINLVFSEMTWQEASYALQQKGWTSGIGSTQQLHLKGVASLKDQDAQLILPDGLSRYHIRLWQAPGPVTLGAVHHENSLIHIIDRVWEDAEAFVAGQLCTSGFSCGAPSELTDQRRIQKLEDGNPDTWRAWANDGSATVMTSQARVNP